MMAIDNEVLAQRLGDKLRDLGATVTTAESCTGGGVAFSMTAIPGSSRWFDRGFVTYTNRSKREMLGVPTDILAKFGAVSEKTAIAMATGALQHSQAQYVLAITGIAGPGGGTAEKPVGTVCFAWAGTDRDVISKTMVFPGDRSAVRQQSIQTALQGMLDFIR
jgi:nicotinamide-nucleotide amidase